MLYKTFKNNIQFINTSCEKYYNPQSYILKKQKNCFCIGQQGTTGSTGSTGAQGPIGPQGPQGTTGDISNLQGTFTGQYFVYDANLKKFIINKTETVILGSGASGSTSGNDESSVAIGAFAIASGESSIAMGKNALTTKDNMIVLNSSGVPFPTTQNEKSFYVSYIRNDNTPQQPSTLHYDATTGEVTYGNEASDYRIKENINIIDGSQSLEIIKNITPISFNYKNQKINSKQIGVLANELELIDKQFGSVVKIRECLNDVQSTAKYDRKLLTLTDPNKKFTLYHKETISFNGNHYDIEEGIQVGTILKIVIDANITTAKVTEVIDEQNIKINIDDVIIPFSENVFVEGIIVDDLRVLNHNNILFMMMNAIKEQQKQLNTLQQNLK